MMASDFSKPQRQSKIGIIVMFFYTLQQYARAFWPLLVLWIYKYDSDTKWYVLPAIAILLIGTAVVSYLKFLNFTFFLDNESEEFVITEGVLNKTRTSIQLNKIQQVNINQSLIQRLIGVYELSVDTAGSNTKEGTIKAIPHGLALELKARLLENEGRITVSDEHTAEAAQTTVRAPQPFISIGLLSLLKVGITSNYGRSLSLLLVFFFTIYENVTSFGNSAFEDESAAEKYIDSKLNFDYDVIMQSILFLVLLLFFAVLVINVFRVVLKYFDYTITKQSGSMLLTYGLLNRKNTIIKPEKVQITTVTQNYLQRKMNILEINIRQAISGEDEKRDTAIEIPGCSAGEREAILQLLFGAIPQKGSVMKPNFRKLGFALFLTIIVPLSVYTAAGYWIDTRVFDVVYLVPVYIVLIGLIQFFAFKNYRLYVNDDYIIRQSGAWDISNAIVLPGKIQSLTTSQLFWHKRLDIGTLTIHTAGGDIAFNLGNFSSIQQYVNQWLYEIETSDINWM